jgi:hypothetical protein
MTSFELADLPAEEKCYLVFQGKPSPIWFDHGDAERYAEELCPEPGDKATIMVIPKASLKYAMVAINHGVVLHSLSSVEDDEE